MREKKYTKPICIRLTEDQYTILSLIPGGMGDKCRSLINKALRDYISKPLM